MRPFDTYVVVDWSAASTPCTGADSVWIASLDRGGSDVELANPATRLGAEAHLRHTIDARPGRRALVAIDVSLGYPAGSAALFGLTATPPWRAVWDAIAGSLIDDPRNRNNRFAVASELNRRAGGGPGPFWGCPRGSATQWLTTTKQPLAGVDEFRACEYAVRATGRRPASAWQLLGAGSVGGQTLTAIPVLRRLLGAWRAGGRRADVWPFTTGLIAPTSPAQVVVAEVWPTWFDPPLFDGTIRDAAQVEHTARCLATADAAGTLGSWFAPSLPIEAESVVVAEEGWVLGVPG